MDKIDTIFFSENFFANVKNAKVITISACETTNSGAFRMRTIFLKDPIPIRNIRNALDLYLKGELKCK